MWREPVELVELHPEWVDISPDAAHAHASAERWGLGVSFDCLCGCKKRVEIRFVNPLDGFAAEEPPPHAPVLYQRHGGGWGEMHLVPTDNPHDTAAHFKGFILAGEVFFGRLQ